MNYKRRSVLFNIGMFFAIAPNIYPLKFFYKDKNIDNNEHIILNYINSISSKYSMTDPELTKYLSVNYIRELNKSIDKEKKINFSYLKYNSTVNIFEEIFKSDFKNDRTENLDGWILPQNEVVILALDQKYKSVYK